MGEQLIGLIETNAGIVADGSGGPLVNSSGRVTGIDAAASAPYQFQTAYSLGDTISVRRIDQGGRTHTATVVLTAGPAG